MTTGGPDEGWEEVFRGTQAQVETFAGILGAHGLETQVLPDSFMGLAFVGAESAALFVPEHEARRARELLSRARG